VTNLLLFQLYRWGFSKKTADEEDGDEEGAHIYIHNVSARVDLVVKNTVGKFFNLPFL